MRNYRRGLVVLLAFGLAAGTVAADTHTAVASGNWSTPGTWSPAGPPAAGDDVIIAIPYTVTVDAATSQVDDVTINSGATLAGGSVQLNMGGNWQNDGTFTCGTGTVAIGYTTPAANTTIGGANPTTFYKLTITKDVLATTVTMNANVTASQNAAGALTIVAGTLSTNGRDLTVNAGTSASVCGDNSANGRLDINTGGTATIANVEQQSGYLTPVQGLGTVTVGPGTTVTITGLHRIAPAQGPVHHICTISGGTVNYTGTGTDLNFDTGWMYAQGTTLSGWYATGGTITISGSISATWFSRMATSGTAVVILAGNTSSTWTMHSYMGTASGYWILSDLRIQKSPGFGVTITSDPIGRATQSFVANNLTVASGSTLTLRFSGFVGSLVGWQLANVTNNGTITHDNNGSNVGSTGDIVGCTAWSGTGTYTQTSAMPLPNLTVAGSVGAGSIAATGTVSLSGSLACAGAFSGPGSLYFTGSGANTISGGSGFAPLYVSVNKPGGSLAAASDIGVRNLLDISAGTFALGEHTLTLGAVAASGNLMLASGTAFSAVGSALDANARVTAVSGNWPYSFTVPVGASMAARYATFERMNQFGIAVSGTVDATDNFSYCRFDHGAAAGPMLSIDNDQTLDDIVEVTFSGTTPYYNVSKPNGAGHITITGGGGNCWGYAYEQDPNDLADWRPLPDAPVLDQPVNNALDVPIAGRLSWNAAANAAGYDVYLDTRNPPAVIVSSNQPGLTYDYADLLNGQAYWWKVVARNGAGNTASEVRKFTTIVGQPGAFELYSPANGDTNLPVSGILIWYPSVNAATYDVYLGKIEPPESVATVTGPFCAFGPLDKDVTYYWTVKAKNAAGELPTSSGTWWFKTSSGLAYAAWKEFKSMPDVPSNKQVKDGGWLTVAAPGGGDRYVYAAKGNKTTDFYRYSMAGDSWTALAPIQADEGGRSKPPKKGCVGVSDGADYIYMAKGNNTLGFWRYDIADDSWNRLPDVPEGASGKRVKGGGDLAYAKDENDSGWVYLMKGYKTEFFRFNVQSNHWDTLADVPYGVAPKYGPGSFLTYDEGQHLYAHQAKYTDAGKTHHFMFRYDLAGQQWDETLFGMPVKGLDAGKLKLKKSKDGGAGAWFEGKLYALKGGNTCQFYRYDVAQGDSWVELDTMPAYGSSARKKKVKAGGDLVSIGGGAFYALKGNKTNEFWRYIASPGAYGLPLTANRSGVMSEREATGEWRLVIAPNPLVSGFATLRYSLSRPGPVTLTVFDVAGRSVMRQTYCLQRKASSVPLDLRRLANGVYVVRLGADGYSQSQKLVVEK